MDDSLTSKFLAHPNSFIIGQDEKLECLSQEVNLISDPKIKALVEYVLSKSDLFWVAPSSQTEGAYPPDERVTGGLALHVKRSIKCFVMMEPVLELTSTEKDYAIAALLLRNVTKALSYDEDSGDVEFDVFHIYTVDDYLDYLLADTANNDEDVGPILGILQEDLYCIERLIHHSSGYLTPIPETFPKTLLEKAIFLAAFWAANSFYILTGEEDD